MRSTSNLTAPSLAIVVVLVLLSAWNVRASITIMESGAVFPSRPEKKLGHQLWKGNEYMGRLQFVHGNLQLCKSAQDPHRRFAITESMDGLPVAIYAKSGGCTLEEKAFVASTLLDPPNIVGYLIVDDDRSGRKKKPKSSTSSMLSFLYKVEILSEEQDDLLDDFIDSFSGTETGATDEDLGLLWDELLTQVQKQPQTPFEARTLAPLELEKVWSGEQSFLVETLANDDETAPPMSFQDIPTLTNTDDNSAGDDTTIPLLLERFRVKLDENAWWSGGDEIQNDDGAQEENTDHRMLKHHRERDSINVAILHVSNRVGYDLLDLLLKESSEIGRVGGPKILLNSKEPNASARTILVWTMLSIAVSACACCCMLVFVEYLGEEEQHPPPQPIRRRLTTNQVREKFPAFHYHPENHVEQPLEDECAICLDNFTEGMRLRKLPCGHVFHSSCISRWLVERSAVCPLCKVDLYVAEEQEDEDGAGHAASLRRRYGPFQSMTSWFSRHNVPTTDVPTRSTFQGSWWTTSRPQERQMAAAPTGESASAVPAAPPARAFQWGYMILPTTAAEVDGQEVDASRSTSPLAAASRWLTRQRRRRGIEATGMLTELTEPLMTTGNADSEDRVSTMPNVITPSPPEVSSLSQTDDSSTPADVESSSSPIEV